MVMGALASLERLGLAGPVHTMAVWIHDLDPVIFDFGRFAIRWYGLAYLLGFVAGYLILRALAKRDLFVLKSEQIGDFIAYAAIFGVFVGGRLGYVLFYMIPERGWGVLAQDPLIVFKVWEGGMASHGAILGLVIFTWFYARRKKVSWPGLGDGLVIVAPLGVCFGRIANFINGELYGRTVQGLAWAMKFPKELHEVRLQPGGAFDEAMYRAVQADPGLEKAWTEYLENPNRGGELLDQAIAVGRDNESVMLILGDYLQARHPSQLYQALLEGLLLFAILLLARLGFPRLRFGILTGMFFVLYAVFRIVAERFREPDAAWIIQDVLTKGQFYSLFMFVIGAAFLVAAWRGKTGRPDTR